MHPNQTKGAVLVLAGVTGLTTAAWAIQRLLKKRKTYDDLDSKCSDLILLVTNILLSMPCLTALSHRHPLAANSCLFTQAWCPSLLGLWQACERMRARKQIPSSVILLLKSWPGSVAWKEQG